jgi:hypothetical protein
MWLFRHQWQRASAVLSSNSCNEQLYLKQTLQRDLKVPVPHCIRPKEVPGRKT